MTITHKNPRPWNNPISPDQNTTSADPEEKKSLINGIPEHDPSYTENLQLFKSVKSRHLKHFVLWTIL